MIPNTSLSTVMWSWVRWLNGQRRHSLAAERATHRMGIGVRHAGDDGSAAYRIPGLVTLKRAVCWAYDVRYNSSVDTGVRGRGVERSTDKGQTWEKIRLPLISGSMGNAQGAEQRGRPFYPGGRRDRGDMGDRRLTHGMGNGRVVNSMDGNGKETTAQLVLAKSTDDGRTWSAPSTSPSG